MYKTYSTIGSEFRPDGFHTRNDSSTKKLTPSIDHQKSSNQKEHTGLVKSVIPAHLRTLMLGVVHRFAPHRGANFMPKWVELTEAGITYFRSATSDKAQCFYPTHVIKDVILVGPPE